MKKPAFQNIKILVAGDFHGKFPREIKEIVKREKIDLIIALGDYTGLDEWRPWVKDSFIRQKKGLERLTPEEYFGKKSLKKLIKKDFKAGLNVLKQLNKLNKKTLIVFGNGDWHKHIFYKTLEASMKKDYEYYLKRMKNLKNINYSRTKFNNINFIGFGGYMDLEVFLKKKPLNENQKSINQRKKALKMSRKKFFSNINKVKNKEEDKIFVFHYPVMGFFDIIKATKDNPMNRKSSGVKFFKEAMLKYKPKLVLCGHMHEYQGKLTANKGKTLILNPGYAKDGKFAIVDWPSLNVKFFK